VPGVTSWTREVSELNFRRKEVIERGSRPSYRPESALLCSTYECAVTQGVEPRMLATIIFKIHE
jgi:hypothetical protein